MLKQSLSQKMLQKLSPQQIQLMKLLQIPTATLEQRIKEELEANPALEEGSEQEDFLAENSDTSTDSETDKGEETYELDDYINEYIEDDPSSYKMKGESYSEEEEDKQIPLAVEQSFHDFLEQQLGLLELKDERKESIARQLIGSIDEDGYLRREPEAIIDDLMFSQNLFVSEDEVLEMLGEVQRLDPPGVGARNLQECLLLQLQNKREFESEYYDDEELRALNLAIDIVDQYFDLFSKKHYEKLQRQLGVKEQELKSAIDCILKLNPKPASGFTGGSDSNGTGQYVIPDFIVTNREGELELNLNSKNAPDLHISDQYRDMLKSYQRGKGQKRNKKEKEAFQFIKQKIDSAKWFIDAIRQRQDTMYRTMYAIMRYQYDYFLTGDPRKLRPMILKDIADITGLDISTISRVANSKFVQTEFGTKRLKEFFSESMQTQEGEEVSTLQVKRILKEVIDNEDKRKPLSDEKLKNILREKGYNIARRTVAKYREQMGLPVARLRKTL